MELIEQYGPTFAKGLWMTVQCTLYGSALGLLLGMVIAFCSLSPYRWLKKAAALYVWLFRGTPFLIQLLIVYSGGPSIGIRLNAFAAGLLTLALFGSAYFSEIFRAGIAAINKGHIEAASCLGMNRTAIFTRIVCPPLFLTTMPMLVNTVISVLKETVVLSVIVVPELMYQIQTMAAETFAYIPAMLSMAILYWVLVEIIAQAGKRAEKHLGRYRH